MLNKDIILDYYQQVLSKKHFNMVKYILNFWKESIKKNDITLTFDINGSILSLRNFFNNLKIYDKYLKIESKHIKYITFECCHTARVNPIKKYFFDVRLVTITTKKLFIQKQLIAPSACFYN